MPAVVLGLDLSFGKTILNMFRDLFSRELFQYDGIFDWTVNKYQANSKRLVDQLEKQDKKGKRAVKGDS
ncbi:hypothetical protein MAP00_007622 [Monascus purpureus]|nr:hypothetical protein MAP00_000001 [Monascus purpureus]BDD62660.1 hypothetical protein MAP00_007622 [Monascus purpureus]